MSTSDSVKQLTAEATRLYAEMQNVWAGGQLAPPKALMDTAEARYFIAARRLLLAQFGLPDAPDQAIFTIKAQKEDLGAMLIVSFVDRLAAIDPLRWFDAVFVPSSSQLQLWHFMSSLKTKTENQRCDEPPRLPAASGAYEEFKRIRRALYPEGLAMPKGKKRRPFTRQEVDDTLAALAAHEEGELLSVELQVRNLDLENMTPPAALETLARLQDQARRIADTKQYLPKSLGGRLPPDT